MEKKTLNCIKKTMILNCLCIIFFDFAMASELKIYGDGCAKKNLPSPIPEAALGAAVQSEVHSVTIPLHLVLENSSVQTTSAEKSVVRKACQFAWPLKVKPLQKVLVRDLSQNYSLQLGKNAREVRIELSLFAAGVGAKTKFNFSSSPGQSGQINHQFSKAGLLIEGLCGKDLMLRGNANGFTSRDPSGADASVKVNAQDLQLKIEYVACS